MLSTKNVVIKEKTASPYLTVGVQVIKVTSIETKASSKGSLKVVFNCESEPHSDPNFKGVNGAYGSVGRISTSYLGNDAMVTQFIEQMASLGTKLGVKEQMDAIEASDVQDFINQVTPLLVDKYFWAKVTGEEYAKATGGVGVNLSFARFGAFASIEEGNAKIKPFDITNKYDYKKAEQAPTSTVSPDTMY